MTNEEILLKILVKLDALIDAVNAQKSVVINDDPFPKYGQVPMIQYPIPYVGDPLYPMGPTCGTTPPTNAEGIQVNCHG